jgi:hypothetical protein
VIKKLFTSRASQFPAQFADRDQPKKRHEHVEFGGDPGVYKRERNGDEVENRRNRTAASFTGQHMIDLKFHI